MGGLFGFQVDLHSLRLTWKLPEGLCKWNLVFQGVPGSFHVRAEGTCEKAISYQLYEPEEAEESVSKAVGKMPWPRF